MTTHLFMIGDSLYNLALLQDLSTPIPDPDFEYFASSEVITLADGSIRGMGAPRVIWQWNILSTAQRDVLKAFCPTGSSEVFISTPIEGGLYYEDFEAVMIWPAEETRDVESVRDLEIEFRMLVRV